MINKLITSYIPSIGGFFSEVRPTQSDVQPPPMEPILSREEGGANPVAKTETRTVMRAPWKVETRYPTRSQGPIVIEDDEDPRIHPTNDKMGYNARSPPIEQHLVVSRPPSSSGSGSHGRHDRRNNPPPERHSRSRRDLNDLQEQYQGLEAAYSRCHQELKQKDRDLAAMEQQLEKYKMSAERFQNEAFAAREELARAEIRHERTTKSLKEQVEELNGVRLFGSQADDMSVADVISLVKALNADIHQVAALIADSVELNTSERSERLSQNELSRSREFVKNILGEDFEKSLRALKKGPAPGREDEYDPTMVLQYALQVATTSFCEGIINDWAPDRKANAWLYRVYDGIRRQEKQAVAGRWRALTRAQFGGQLDQNSVIDILVERLVAILIVTGCSKGQVQADHFKERFKNRLNTIANTTSQLSVAIGEAITSVDLKVYRCPPGQSFETEGMEEAYGEKSGRDIGKPIGGTIGLGLLSQGSTANAPAYEVLVKAKVILTPIL